MPQPVTRLGYTVLPHSGGEPADLRAQIQDGALNVRFLVFLVGPSTAVDSIMISHNAYIVLLVVFQLVGLATYLQGFFPVKKALQGRADHADLAPEPGLDGRGKPLQEKFDRLVIVLVDALRADFVLSGGQRMPYTERLIKNNETVRWVVFMWHPMQINRYKSTDYGVELD